MSIKIHVLQYTPKTNKVQYIIQSGSRERGKRGIACDIEVRG